MAVQDLWRGRDGKPTARAGRGKRWRVRVGDHPSRAFAVKADAVAWERELLRQAPRPGDGLPVAELLTQWLAGKAHLTPRAQLQVRDAASRARHAFGDRYAAEISRAEVQAWVSGLEVVVSGQTRLASHTIRSKALQALAGALEIAVEAGMIPSSPVRGVRIGKPARRPARFLTGAELAALAEASSWPEAIWMLGTGGYRIGELLELTVGDLDAGRRRVRVRKSKTGRERDVPIAAKVLAMLDTSRPAGERLLALPAQYSTMTPTMFRNLVVLPAAREAGLEGVTTHDLRHTAASLAIRSGADVKMVQAMLGHASAAMTLDLYGHLWPSALDDVAARMDALIR